MPSAPQNLSDLKQHYMERPDRAAYACQFNFWNPEIETFVLSWFQKYRPYSAFMERNIPNPTEQQISFFRETVHSQYDLSANSIAHDLLRGWMPRLQPEQANAIAAAMETALSNLRKAGKNENILRNAYIKFMCWLHFRFSQIVVEIMKETVPKLVFIGELQLYEHAMLKILADSGVDVLVFLPEATNANYFPHYNCAETQAFPRGFGLKWIAQNAVRVQSDSFGKQTAIPKQGRWMVETNTASIDDPLHHACENCEGRLSEFHAQNCFYYICGAKNPHTYANDLSMFYKKCIDSGRERLLLENGIPPPSSSEIAEIKRSNGLSLTDSLLELTDQIPYPGNAEFQQLIRYSYCQILSQQEDANPSRTITKAVYLLVWLKRYFRLLKNVHKMKLMPILIYFGACRNEKDVLYLNLMAMLPVDVLIIDPTASGPLPVESSAKTFLYEHSLRIDKFPENTNTQIGTVAYYAERELNMMLYQDSGLYRNYQFSKANTILLKTMYEEIPILWDQELKYRPNFQTTDDAVTIPVIFAKASGVKDGDVPAYWRDIKKLVTDNAILICNSHVSNSQMKISRQIASSFLKGHVLQVEKIKMDSAFVQKFGYLKNENQDRILYAAQQLIDRKWIACSPPDVISTIFTLSTEMIRAVQAFDFTKKNPKIICIYTSEITVSREDSVALALLSLMGFDVLCFVPTGYQCAERYYPQELMQEYQLGKYMYDLEIPRLLVPKQSQRSGLWGRLFG